MILALWIGLARKVRLLTRLGCLWVHVWWLALVVRWWDLRIAVLDWRIRLAARDATHKNRSGSLNDPTAEGQDAP